MNTTIVRNLIFLTSTIFMISCSGSRTSAEDKVVETAVVNPGVPAIIPLPRTISWGKGSYYIPKNNRICFSPGGKRMAGWLKNLLKDANKEVELVEGNSCGNWNIMIDPNLAKSLGDEGYGLSVTNEGVVIQSATEAGILYGLQTLRQFFPPEIEQGTLEKETIALQFAQIQDWPQFQWRGTMVDVARSFFGLEYLKDHVDRMALYKLNRLHLHLTDDQGWRIEIKSKPKLTEVGAKGSVKRGRSGFLTQAEYLELQDYALARNIIIIPEVDMPGHIYSALVAYPELNCDEYSNLTPQRVTPPELFDEYNVGWSKLCLDKPEIYEFVSDVIGELAKITKGPWIHIGGDEIEDPRYKEFVIKADSIVQTYGKTAIGWEEVTKATVSNSLISQQWHGKVESVVPNIKVIHSLCSQFYLDHANVPGQENTNNWCKKTGVSLEDVYSFNTDNENVIGVEAPVWSEFVLTDKMMDNRFWPRAIAVAEVAWTPETRRDFSSFRSRLGRHGDRLRALNIDFFRTPGINWGPERKKPGVFSGLDMSN